MPFGRCLNLPIADPAYGITAPDGPLRHGNRVNHSPGLITEDNVYRSRPRGGLWRSVRRPRNVVVSLCCRWVTCTLSLHLVVAALKIPGAHATLVPSVGPGSAAVRSGCATGCSKTLGEHLGEAWGASVSATQCQSEAWAIDQPGGGRQAHRTDPDEAAHSDRRLRADGS